MTTTTTEEVPAATNANQNHHFLLDLLPKEIPAREKIELIDMLRDRIASIPQEKKLEWTYMHYDKIREKMLQVGGLISPEEAKRRVYEENAERLYEHLLRLAVEKYGDNMELLRDFLHAELGAIVAIIPSI